MPGTGCHSPTQPRACLHRKCLITAPFISSAAVGKGDAVPVAFSARQRLGTLRWPHPSFFLRGAPLKTVLVQEDEDGSLLDPGMQQQ